MRHRSTKSRRPSLNHTYRLIWSEAKKMYIAVAEHAKGGGKSGGGTLVASAAVAGALMALSGGAMAADQCSAGTGSVTLNAGNDCQLNAGETLTASPNSIAVSVPTGVTAGQINNAGSIVGTANNWTKGAVQVEQATLTGGIVNSGTIDGKTQSAILFNGNATTITGGFHNLAGGLIRSDSDGVMANAVTSNTPFHTLSGGFYNAGQIIGDFGYSVYLRDIIIQGDVVNSVTGTITGNDGFYFTGNTGGAYPGGSTITGNLDNYGTMGGTWSGGSANQGVMLDRAVVQGRVFNAASGKMLGTGTGLFLSDAAVNGGVTNAGTIQGGDFGILVEDDSTASITNLTTGRIIGGEAGIHVSQATVTGSITNQAGGWCDLRRNRGRHLAL